MKHVGIEIKFYNLDTFKKQIDVNFIDLDSNLVDLNYKVASLIFCHFWRSFAARKSPPVGRPTAQFFPTPHSLKIYLCLVTMVYSCATLAPRVIQIKIIHQTNESQVDELGKTLVNFFM